MAACPPKIAIKTRPNGIMRVNHTNSYTANGQKACLHCIVNAAVRIGALTYLKMSVPHLHVHKIKIILVEFVDLAGRS